MRGSRAGASGRLPAVRMFPAVAVLTVATALTGCQSNPEPPPLETAPSPSPSPTSTEPTSEPAPTMPAEAEGTSRAAAKAFVRHWIAVLNYAGPSGDASALRAISTSDCAACGGIADFIEEVHEAGGTIEGEGWRPKRITVVSSTQQQVVLDVLTEVSEQKVQSAASAEATTFPGGERIKTFWLSRRNGAWVLARLDQPQ